MIREFLNEILSGIDSESLTDVEFATIPEDLPEDYTKPVYDALKAIVQEREGVSGQLKRLKAYFISKGTDLSGASARDPASQIFFGAPLD